MYYGYQIKFPKSKKLEKTISFLLLQNLVLFFLMISLNALFRSTEVQAHPSDVIWKATSEILE